MVYTMRNEEKVKKKKNTDSGYCRGHDYTITYFRGVIDK